MIYIERQSSDVRDEPTHYVSGVPIIALSARLEELHPDDVLTKPQPGLTPAVLDEQSGILYFLDRRPDQLSEAGVRALGHFLADNLTLSNLQHLLSVWADKVTFENGTGHLEIGRFDSENGTPAVRWFDGEEVE